MAAGSQHLAGRRGERVLPVGTAKAVGEGRDQRRVLSFLSSLFVFYGQILLVEHERSEPFGIQ